MLLRHAVRSTALFLAAWPASAFPHSGNEANTAALDPVAAVLLALLGIVYARGEWRLARGPAPRGARRARAACFWAGWASLALALGPPLESATRHSFAAHMAQHEILMLVAAPFLVVARPFGVLLWGLPKALAGVIARAAQARATRSVVLWLSSAVIAWLVHAAVLWGWHVPGAFEAALAHTPIHWLQHIVFFSAAVIFWWSVLGAGLAAERKGAAIVSVFTTAVHTSFLGVLLTFSTHVWYATYAQAIAPGALSAIEDQQLGGLIMWIPGGTVFVIAGIALMLTWLRDAEKHAAMSRWEGARTDVAKQR